MRSTNPEMCRVERPIYIAVGCLSIVHYISLFRMPEWARILPSHYVHGQLASKLLPARPTIQNANAHVHTGRCSTIVRALVCALQIPQKAHGAFSSSRAGKSHVPRTTYNSCQPRPGASRLVLLESSSSALRQPRRPIGSVSQLLATRDHRRAAASSSRFQGAWRE